MIEPDKKSVLFSDIVWCLPDWRNAWKPKQGLLEAVNVRFLYAYNLAYPFMSVDVSHPNSKREGFLWVFFNFCLLAKSDKL